MDLCISCAVFLCSVGTANREKLLDSVHGLDMNGDRLFGFLARDGGLLLFADAKDALTARSETQLCFSLLRTFEGCSCIDWVVYIMAKRHDNLGTLTYRSPPLVSFEESF